MGAALLVGQGATSIEGLHAQYHTDWSSSMHRPLATCGRATGCTGTPPCLGHYCHYPLTHTLPTRSVTRVAGPPDHHGPRSGTQVPFHCLLNMSVWATSHRRL
jgi:hypothetical protein